MIRSLGVRVLASAVIGWLGFAGCVSADLKRARAVEEGLVGLTIERLVSCAGQPKSDRQTGDVRTLTYYQGCGLIEEEFPTTRGTMSRERRHGCEATFEVQGNQVRRAIFMPLPDGAPYELYHCEERFAACVNHSLDTR